MNQNKTPAMIKTALACLFAASLAAAFRASAQSNTFNVFTYQGRLTDDFGPGWDDSPRTWEFLFQAVIPPYPCADIIDCPWPTNCPNCAKFALGTNSVLVDKGLFTTHIKIPKGPPFSLDPSNGVYLEISVRTNSGVPFTTLSPLQLLTATPFATVAQSVSGPIPASSLIGTMPTGFLTGTFSSPVNFSNASNHFAGDGSLLANINAATIGGTNACDLTCYWRLTGNTGTDPKVNFLGTTDSQPLELRVNGVRANRYQSPTDLSVNTPDLIGGSAANTILQSGGSVIGGGGTLTAPNTIRGVNNVIGGGTGNQLDLARWSVIGGGHGNQMQGSGLASTEYSFIGGGQSNTLKADWSGIGGGLFNRVEVSADEFNAVATLGGGAFNTIFRKGGTIAGGGNQLAGLWASVGGGFENHAIGDYAAIPGGRSGVADHYGQFAFAAGHMDRAGDAQASTFILRRKFSGNGDLFLNGDTSDARITVPVGAVWTLHFQVSAVSVSGTNFGAYEVSGVIANLGGTPTFRLMDGSGAVVGTARPIYETLGAIPWLATPYLSADNSLRVAVFAGELVKWSARLDVAEVRR